MVRLVKDDHGVLGGAGKAKLPRAAYKIPKGGLSLEAIRQDISDLTEMAPSYHFAKQALNMLRYLAKKWHVKVDICGSCSGNYRISVGKTTVTTLI